MNHLSKGELEQLSEEFDNFYDEEYPDVHPGVEERLTELLQMQDYLGPEDVADAVRWKLANQPGRRDRYIEMVRSVPAEFIEQVTSAAFLVEDARLQMKTIESIPGIGYATATVLIAFRNPVDYAVGDRYINEAVLGLENASVTPGNYEDLLVRLRELNPGGYDLRTVEKAYYKAYVDSR